METYYCKPLLQRYPKNKQDQQDDDAFFIYCSEDGYTLRTKPGPRQSAVFTKAYDSSTIIKQTDLSLIKTTTKTLRQNH